MIMGDDLMYQNEIRQSVREAYSAIPIGGGEAVTRRSYSAEELGALPAGAVAWALGVGNPVPPAGLRPGETVLDIGSGAGIDTILAARRVGPTGRAIGLDMLEEMCERARRHAREAGVDGWAEFRRGEMEDIPLPGSSVDVVISNGVINLSARKSRAPRRDLPGAAPGWADVRGRPDRRRGTATGPADLPRRLGGLCVRRAGGERIR
jgi:arsenite methyltransferase